MDQNRLRAALADLADDAAPTPLADRALRRASRRRQVYAGIGVVAATAVLAAIPFLLPGADRATEPAVPGIPAAGVSADPSADPSVSTSPTSSIPVSPPTTSSVSTSTPTTAPVSP